jgi:hypothetical protein
VRLVALISAGLLLPLGLPVVALAGPAAAQGLRPASALMPAAFVSASTQAAATGDPVEVPSETTETTKVMAQPDGSFDLTSNRLPVRVEQDGTWVPIDTRLHQNDDGSWSPAATTAPVSFASGGSTNMVSIGAENKQVSFDFPTNLPAPTVSGDSATYADVRPGIDLVLTAQPAGYTDTFVVHTASAAEDLTANPIHLSGQGDGLSLSQDSTGTLQASSGATPMYSAQPQVSWDSSGDTQAAGHPDPTDPGDSVVAPATNAQTPTTSSPSVNVAVTVPSTLLDDPGTTYPVYIDPDLQYASSHYLTVEDNGNDYYDSASQPMRVGYCDYAECPGHYNARSFFQFSIAALSGSDQHGAAIAAVVDDATVTAYENHNAASAAEPVTLTKADSFTASTNYPGPVGANLLTVSSAQGAGSDPGGNVVFNNAAIQTYMQADANAAIINARFSLSAPAANNDLYWKKFDNNPTLDVKYDFAPSTPEFRTISSAVTCTNPPTVYTSDNTPTVSARAHDNNPDPLPVGLWFEIANAGSSTVIRSNSSAIQGAGDTQLGWTTTPALPDGNYQFHTWAASNSPDTANAKSSTTTWWPFTVDSTPPAAPTLSSFQYPNGYWGPSAASPGTFTVTDTSTDTVGFSYDFDTSGGEDAPDPACQFNVDGTKGQVQASAGQATITVPSTLGSGYHRVYVRAFDHAHNSSTETSYDIYVAPTFGASGTNLVEAESSVAPDPDGPTDAYVYSDSSSAWSNSAESHIIANSGSPTNPPTVTYAINPTTDAYYGLGLRLNTCNHCGILHFLVDGEVVPTAIGSGVPLEADTYSATPGSTYVPLGGLSLNAGVHHIAVQVVGKNPSSTNYSYTGTFGATTLSGYDDNGYSAGVDSITVAPLSDVNYPNLQSAFNNRGIGVDGSTATSFDLLDSLNKTSLSASALSAAGLTQGAPLSVPDSDGSGNTTTFDIPTAYGTDAYDNVIAAGQTISMADGSGNYSAPGTPENPGYVNVLVAATCGTIPVDPSSSFTLNFTNTPTGDVPIGSLMEYVPDWTTGGTSGGEGVLTTSQYLVNTTASTTQTPSLFVLKLPIPSDYGGDQLKSVTLPEVGTTFTHDCATHALHVFAMSTSVN